MGRTIQWYGAHPEECSQSMNTYRRNLVSCIDPKDPPTIRCWPENDVLRAPKRLRRAAGRYLGYPMRVRLTKRAEVVHFLDHSSSHLIPHVPRGVRVVVTLHDIIPLRFRGRLTDTQVTRFRDCVMNLRFADRILSDSESTKLDAVELLGIDPEKLEVSPLGVRMPSRRDEGRTSKFIDSLRSQGAEVVLFSIGSDIDRKNLAILAEAVGRAQQGGGVKIGVLRVGAPLRETTARSLREVVGDKMLIEAGRLSDCEVELCYAGCDLVFIPSLYEGFGLPVLEAFAHGKAVACSNATSLPEVGGELAEYFDPTCAGEAGRAILECINQRGEEAELKRIGRARDHSWERHFSDCLAAYEKVLS